MASEVKWHGLCGRVIGQQILQCGERYLPAYTEYGHFGGGCLVGGLSHLKHEEIYLQYTVAITRLVDGKSAQHTPHPFSMIGL
jgi:hypothetical protein